MLFRNKLNDERLYFKDESLFKNSFIVLSLF
jgi:hypothetical protein